MGAWGPGIFANDIAADAREEWRDALSAGEEPAAASARIVERFGGAGEDVDFWTGLAAAQHQTGHLQHDVRDQALALIAAGGDLELWEGGDEVARARALDRLAAKLRGPQPAPKKLRGPRPGPEPGVEAGDVLRVWSHDGRRWALFCVLGFEEVRRSRWPVVLGLFTDDDQAELPPESELACLPYLSDAPLEAGEEIPDSFPVDAPLLWACTVERRGDEFGPHIGEIVARGIRPLCLQAVEEQTGSEPGELLTDEITSLAALVELVDSPGLDLCREATRRRLSGRGAAARREFQTRQAKVQQHWLAALRGQLDQPLPEDADVSPREAARIAELRDAAAEILDGLMADPDDDPDD